MPEGIGLERPDMHREGHRFDSDIFTIPRYLREKKFFDMLEDINN